MPFDPKKQGFLSNSDANRLADSQLVINKAHVRNLTKMNRDAKGATTLTEGQVYELAQKGQQLMMKRRREWKPLDALAPPVVFDDEQSQLYEDTLTVTAPKFIYTVVVPEGMNLDECIDQAGPITFTKTYTLEAGEFPVSPDGHYTLDINKDFAPAYVRTGMVGTNGTIAAHDRSLEYVRTQVVPKYQKGLAAYRADSLTTEMGYPDTRSLAEDIQADTRLECHAQILGLSRKNPFPSDDNVRKAKTLVKNIKAREAMFNQ